MRALDEAGPAQRGEVMGDSVGGNVQLARRDLAPAPDEQEEQLQPRLVGEGGERLDVPASGEESGPGRRRGGS